MSEDEKSLSELFDQCEKAINDYDDGNYPSEKLKDIIDILEKLTSMIKNLNLFSSNEDFTELPSSSLRYLLVPAYLGYVLENLNDIDHRLELLKSARAFFRNYCEVLLNYNIIEFKLPWLNDEGQLIENSEEFKLPEKKDYAVEREKKIGRMKAEKQLKNALEKLEIEKRRNNDESTMRQSSIVLLRLWALKAVNEIQAIENELPLLQHRRKIQSGEIKPEKHKTPPIKLPPFIITKTEQQKKVFGMGYPSLPTYTVDQWYEGMVKSGKFGDVNNLNVKRIENVEGNGDVVAEYEDDSEEARQKAIRMDEFKDWHKRGEGNTYGKG